MKKNLYFLLFIVFTITSNLSAQNLYSIDTIQKIEVYFLESNWDEILDTAKAGSDSYTMAQWVKINGIQFDSVGVKYKGNSSYNANYAKNPIHIELDNFKNQDYHGYTDIKLSNGFHEPSCVREVLLYSILKNYMKVSQANFAQVYINGQEMGLYTNVEAVNNSFMDDRFYSNNNTFVFGDEGGCDLTYKGNDTTLYMTPYTMKSDYGLTDLKNLCDTLKNNITHIENILDVDRTLWMLAFNNDVVNLDSYQGNSKHNYYLYEDHNGRFNPIVWDLNLGFGGFNKAQPGPVGLTTLQMQNMSPMLHSTDSLWPLVKNILAVPLYKHMYIAHMKTIMSENIENLSYQTYAQYLQTIIDTAVQSDPIAFYTYADFLSNVTTSVVDGIKIIPGITELMIARNTYLNSTTEFQQIPPTISNVQLSDAFPIINTSIFITATITNENAVYLGIRNSFLDRFTRIQMFDDGLNGDGNANDGVYGISVLISSPEAQYYIYADNSNAGIFSPARSENEYYSINSNYALLSEGDLVINEIMAINGTTIQDANGLYGDWIELYNPTENSISLDNLYISDDVENRLKWQFPLGISIPAYGYQIIWGDDDTSSVTEIHCNFNLSGSGEQVVLSYANGIVIDSTTFSEQTVDLTWGRIPNGTGPFVFMMPSFNGVNSIVGIEELADKSTNIQVYPNPSNGTFTINHEQGIISELIITDILGNIVFENRLNAKKEMIELELESGIYFYDVKDSEGNYSSGKIIVQ